MEIIIIALINTLVFMGSVMFIERIRKMKKDGYKLVFKNGVITKEIVKGITICWYEIDYKGNRIKKV